jgi:hypothetical protein
MKQKKESTTKRLEKIRSKVEFLIEKNRGEVGTGKEISTIEQELLVGILDIGKLLLEDRIIEEREELENTGYRIEGKKNKNYGK